MHSATKSLNGHPDVLAGAGHAGGGCAPGGDQAGARPVGRGARHPRDVAPAARDAHARPTCTG
ncbi:hypothetical protein [Aquisphaera giovannonii]|uniref:hypothetical protein n=1 Tax=Aquisphaera giovannonii TaxID=406548 RepID=UPI0036F1F060